MLQGADENRPLIRQLGRKPVTKAAIRFPRANAAKFGIDPNHIGVMGESAGGGVAAMAGTTCGVTARK